MVITPVSILGYRISEELYNGSRTLVYRGYRETDSLRVVIKLLKNPYPSFSELVQFRHQYTIAKNLNSPLIIQTYSLEPYQNGYVLVMEDFGGISLKEWRVEGSVESLMEFLRIAIALCNSLDILYHSRIIHKDIKPANILINLETKQVKLIDFSIASLLPRETQTLINPNFLEGTLSYISPEQTGRMNRGIDYRTDFYSLGVTFYELLTGELPFQSNDPMELVHCHIAKLPSFLGKREEIPQVLCDLVMKLMAKNAEDRYQSALGIKFDLENCLTQLQETGKLESFEIAQKDVCARFLIREKLYGRETEVQQLLEAFERVSQGSSELMLVAGFSGIGKTSVVNEVHKPIVQKRGYFISGKFDQFRRNVPYSAIVVAFRKLIQQLLTESESQFNQWREKLQNALQNSGEIIIELIPEIELIIGKQPPVPELGAVESQIRFNSLFQRFIGIFCAPEHPLVIFLDDLQWADTATLKLLELMLTDDAEIHHLFVIGAYRDNEVEPTHPLLLIAMLVPLFYFYSCLILTEQYPKFAFHEQGKIIEELQSKLKQIKVWSANCAENFEHFNWFVQAEIARISNQHLEAMELYDQAIASAHQHGFIHHEAIIHEQVAKFWLRRNKEGFANLHLHEAYYAYQKWGAKAKVADIKIRYSQLFQAILPQEKLGLNSLKSIIATASTETQKSTHTSKSSGMTISDALDFASILKAAQSISSSIELDDLITSLTKIILENVGAKKCVLILPQEDKWQIRAITFIDHDDAHQIKTSLTCQLVDDSQQIPRRLIQYVKHTLQTIVIDNCQTDIGGLIDDYMLRQQPQSALCTPILNQGNLVAIIYLENRLTQGVFTSDRLSVINLFCSQAAISLENARLYQKAGQALQDLQQAQLQIVQSEKMSALGNLVAGIAHEMNNPLGFISISLKQAKPTILDIIEHLKLYQKNLPNPGNEIKEHAEEIDLDYTLEDLLKMINSMSIACDRLKNISTSLRTFSRADQDYKVPFNIHEGIDSTILILKHRLKPNEQHPAIEVITNYGKLPQIECFPGQLNQVFMNIMANAIDALEESNQGRSFEEIKANHNCITITTSVETNLVKITIADNGIGMSESVKEKIFDHLFTTKSVGKGTGLGLAIARQILVEKHNGMILVNSTLGEGTEFVITLPILAPTLG